MMFASLTLVNLSTQPYSMDSRNVNISLRPFTGTRKTHKSLET